MRKNIVLFILSLTLVVVTCKYVSVHCHLNALQKQLEELNTVNECHIKFYEAEDKIFYHLSSDDNKLWIYFTYDEQGLKETFGVKDDLSKKMFGFNFAEEGTLASFIYQDNQYKIINNVSCIH